MAVLLASRSFNRRYGELRHISVTLPGAASSWCSLAFLPVCRRLRAPDIAHLTTRTVFSPDIDGRRFAQLTLPGTDSVTSADGIRCDVDGNVWCGARPGVQIVAPDGDTIGTIRLPEVCANVCFGGAKRNRLFMAASQSLYALYVNTQGVAGG